MVFCMAGFIWPIVIAALILGIAAFLLYFLEDFYEFSFSFLWIAAFFIILYIAAAGFIAWKLPNPLKTGIFTANAQTTETEVTDVVVR